MNRESSFQKQLLLSKGPTKSTTIWIVPTVYKAVQLAADVKPVLERAGFQLRYWMSNYLEVLKRIREHNTHEIKKKLCDGQR